jgi:hypothetical protein
MAMNKTASTQLKVYGELIACGLSYEQIVDNCAETISAYKELVQRLDDLSTIAEGSAVGNLAEIRNKLADTLSKLELYLSLRN